MKSRRNKNLNAACQNAGIESLENRQLMTADQSLARVLDAGQSSVAASALAQATDATQAQLLSPRGAIAENNPQFRWSAVSNAARYEFWVSNARNERVLYHAGLTGTAADIDGTLPAGSYRWWIRAFDARGRAGSWSTPADFQIAAPQSLRPVLQGPTGTINTQQPEFTWTGIPGAARYELWVSNSQSLRVVHNPNVVGTSTQISTGQIAAGNYRWWVRAYNAAGAASAWSAPMDFTVQVVPPRTEQFAPTGEVSSGSPDFQWPAINGTVRYELWVNNAQGQRVVHNNSLAGTSTSLSGSPLSPGNYRWWVRGFNSAGTASTWSRPIDFRIVGGGTSSGGDDDREDNDSINSANSLGQLTATTTIRGLVMADDADWFSFDIGGTGTSTSYAKINFDHASGDLDLKLYDQSGQLVRESDSTNNEEIVSLESLPAGRYYLQAFGYDGVKNPGYTLEISPATGGGNTNSSDAYHTLYVNFDGANMSYDDLVRWNSGTWANGILNGLDPERDGVAVEAFMPGDQAREQTISRILQYLQADLTPFGVTVQRVRNGVVEGAGSTTIFVGNTNMALLQEHGGIACDIDRGNSNPTDIAFANPSRRSGEDGIRGTADTILHEAGHTWGLFHVNTAQNGAILSESMGYLYTQDLYKQTSASFDDTSFLNVTFIEFTDAKGQSNGIDPQRTEYQNSYQEMMKVFGNNSTSQALGQLRTLTTTASGNLFQLQSLSGDVHVSRNGSTLLVQAGGEQFVLSGEIGGIQILASATQQSNIFISSELRHLVRVSTDASVFDQKLAASDTEYWNGSELREFTIDCDHEHLHDDSGAEHEDHEHDDHEHHDESLTKPIVGLNRENLVDLFSMSEQTNENVVVYGSDEWKIGADHRLTGGQIEKSDKRSKDFGSLISVTNEAESDLFLDLDRLFESLTSERSNLSILV